MYEKDLKHGYGKMTYADGTVYEGNWRGGKQEGKGEMYDRSGRREQGNWQNGVVVNRI